MWLVKQEVAPAATCIEHAYEENVHVVNGRALVQRQSTLDYLHTCGYRVVRELPSLETMMRQNPQHVMNLARQGLGPLAGREDLDELQSELNETGRIEALQGPAPEPDPEAEQAEGEDEPLGMIAALSAERDDLVAERDELAGKLGALAAEHGALQSLYEEALQQLDARVDPAASTEPEAEAPAEGEEAPAEGEEAPAEGEKPKRSRAKKAA